MILKICSIGTAVPEHSITQQNAAELAVQLQGSSCHVRAIKRLYQRSGVAARHSVLLSRSSNGLPATQTFYRSPQNALDRGPTLADRIQIYEQCATDLAVRATLNSIRDIDVSPERITHLISISCTGFAAPGFDLQLCERIGLNRQVARTHIGFMGCHALLNGLRMARMISMAEPDAVVLVCAVELCTLHQQYSSDAEKLVSNSLFADGAAALICSAESNDDSASHAVTTSSNYRLVANGSQIVPDSQQLMSWRMGDYGFEMTLDSAVPKMVETHLRPWLHDWLQQRGYSIEDVASWAVHPGGPRILDAVEQTLRLPADALEDSRQILANYGNMSSPTVAFVLERLVAAEKFGPCVMLAFGPGLTIEAALLS